jgi:hypothetical protein
MNQTWQEWSMDGPDSKFYPIDAKSIQDGCLSVKYFFLNGTKQIYLKPELA